MKCSLQDVLYIIYDYEGDTYAVGGGSSTPAKVRVFESLDKALRNRNRWWPKCTILEYNIANKAISND